MKVGSLIRVRNHSTARNGWIGIFMKKRNNPFNRYVYVIEFPDRGWTMPLSIDQCEVICEGR